MKKRIVGLLALFAVPIFADTSSEIDYANEALAQVVQDIFVVNVSAFFIINRQCFPFS